MGSSLSNQQEREICTNPSIRTIAETQNRKHVHVHPRYVSGERILYLDKITQNDVEIFARNSFKIMFRYVAHHEGYENVRTNS